MSTETIIEEQRTGSELNVPECLAATPMMKEWAIDLVSELPLERKQFMLDLVQKRYDYPGDDEKLKLHNPIGFLKDMIRLDSKHDDEIVVIPKCLLDDQVNEEGVLNMINYLPAEEQQALLNYVDDQYQAEIKLHNEENKNRWEKPRALVVNSPIRFLSTIIENGISEDGEEKTSSNQETLPKQFQSILPDNIKLEDLDIGKHFLTWISEGLTERTIQVNSSKALVHIVKEGALIVSPIAFKKFIWAFELNPEGSNINKQLGRIQERLRATMSKNKLHRRTKSGVNIHSYQVSIEKRVSKINGWLVPIEILFGENKPPSINTALENMSGFE